MEQEEYIVDGHKVTHSVHLGDREIFLAVQQDAPLPFYVGYMEVSYELGLARFSGIEGTTEYTGEHTYIRRTDVMGAVKPDRLPGWAKEKAAAQNSARLKRQRTRRIIAAVILTPVIVLTAVYAAINIVARQRAKKRRKRRQGL